MSRQQSWPQTRREILVKPIDPVFAKVVRREISEMHWRLRRTLPVPLGALVRLNKKLFI